MTGHFELALFVVAVLVAASIVSTRLAYRAGAPILLVVLMLGLVAGEDGVGIRFDDVEVAFGIGSVALALILFDSGFGTPRATLRLAAGPALVLATAGVLATATLFGIAAHALLGYGWIESLLLGAIVGSTDAAAVFFLLRVGGITIRERVRSILEIESGSNDPMAILVTVTIVAALTAGAAGPGLDAAALAKTFLVTMGLGAVAGIAGGHAVAALLNRLELEGPLYPLMLATAALALFGLTAVVGGSGYVAVYVAGLVAGNRPLKLPDDAGTSTGAAVADEASGRADDDRSAVRSTRRRTHRTPTVPVRPSPSTAYRYFTEE
jgi:cell volume regulation protein A